MEKGRCVIDIMEGDDKQDAGGNSRGQYPGEEWDYPARY